MSQSQTDIKEKWHGDPLMHEKLIDVLWSAMYLLGKPSGGTSLSFQLRLNATAKMYGLSVQIFFVIFHTLLFLWLKENL
jgi:hypothetical protein